MKKGKKGFVVSAVLYPLLVLFLAIIMGLLSMTDTRKRILDKMKLEITDNIFDDAACSCDTILAKLNYIIANGTGESGGDTGSYAYNKLTLNVKTYEAYSDFPVVGNIIGDIAVLSTTPIKNYYVSTSVPKSPQEGTVWIVQDNTSNYYVTSDWNRIGISYVMQYENSKWVLKKSYVYNGESWTMLYYVNLKNGYVDLTGTDINAEITKTYDYTGEYQTFKTVFSGYYKIELWGAQGGSYQKNTSSFYGGHGAYTSGEIYLDAGEIIYIYVGGTGDNYKYTNNAGWNGGGSNVINSSSSAGMGGGGATDIRLVSTTEKNIWNEFESLKSRIMVAAGGGGANRYYVNDSNYGYDIGGAGGELTGYEGTWSSRTSSDWDSSRGTGATQSLGGYRYNNPLTYNGGFGYGGSTEYGGAGGGGYYGGGGGGGAIGAGGGGSSYVSGYKGCNSILESSESDNIIHSGNPYHYSHKYFENIVIMDGKNTKMPSHGGDSFITGNSGNGYAKITLTRVQLKTSAELSNEYENQDKTYAYSYSGVNINAGRYQIFEAEKTGTYKIELWGAQGGSYQKDTSNFYGGHGAYTSGEISVTKGQKFYIYVGSQGNNFKYTDNAGWNGGGSNSSNNSSSAGLGGGGATDVRLSKTSLLTSWNEFESLKSRIMVAAGGGGANRYYNNSSNYGYDVGGAGGGLVGHNGAWSSRTNSDWDSSRGIGGTQSLGGYRQNASSTSNGGFGYGGSTEYGGAGGGGYYGGGGGGNAIGAGGGGSSYISGYEGCSSIEEESTAINIIHNGNSFHYSNYYFTNTLILDGKNSNMPTHDGDKTMNGNTGDGYAKISFINSNENKNKRDNTWNYMYSGENISVGRYQIFDVPYDGYYNVELWGAQGGSYQANYGSFHGGLGAYTSGKIYLSKGTKLYIYVGSQGDNFKYTDNAGWNGGGSNTSNNTNQGLGGGGATDVRLNVTSSLNLWKDFSSLKSRIMVAAGGGGANRYYNSSSSYAYDIGGAGGGLIGYDGTWSNRTDGSWDPYRGTGGTQSLGGYRYNDPLTSNGSFGYGSSSSNGGAGGGGYYGGGGGAGQIGAGGGGSSYISGYKNCNSIQEESTENEIIHNGSAYHYSNYYFSNAVMLDGNSSSVPSPIFKEQSTGNKGDGVARITLLEKFTKTVTNSEIDEQKKSWSYDYSGLSIAAGRYQIFEVPKTGTYKIELWGAQGGSYLANTTDFYGGYGAYTSGEIALTKGLKLYIYVGSQGNNFKYTDNAGWNGGGYNTSNASNTGMGGGGATDIRVVSSTTLNLWSDPKSLKTRIMVAAGGGGANRYYNGSSSYAYDIGGAGGGLIGYDGTWKSRTESTWDPYRGTGGTQIAGGHIYRSENDYKGSFGYGANSSNGGAGGGGWYGGGGASGQIGAGGGGSSYISGFEGCIAVDSSSTAVSDKYSKLDDSISYTGYKFANSIMIDGAGYQWTIEKSTSSTGMTSKTGDSIVKGNTGNGYAKITYLGA